MPLLVTDKGSEMILKAYFNNAWAAGGNDLTLNLFTNNYTPVDGSVIGNFTLATGGGYIAKNLARGSWTIGTNDPRDAIFAEQTFTFTGPLTGNASVYGYVVTDADNNVIFAELLGTGFPYQPLLNGDSVKITPKFQASKGTPAA
jgi:hypothetical protein